MQNALVATRKELGIDGDSALMAVRKGRTALETAVATGDGRAMHRINKILSKGLQLYAKLQEDEEAAKEAKILELDAGFDFGWWWRTNGDHTGNDQRKKAVSHDDQRLKVPVPDWADYNDTKRWMLVAQIGETYKEAKERYEAWKDERLAIGNKEFTAAALRGFARAYVNRPAREAMLKRLAEIVSGGNITEFDGVYETLVIDPPWVMEKIERDVALGQVLFDYPTLSVENISKIFPPFAPDSHVWMWTTHKYLPHAFYLFNLWEVKYICTFTWNKNGGFQPFNLPQFNTEFAIYGHVGNPQFVTTKNFKTGFTAPRGEHSEKPEEFYDMVRRVTSGRRLDMYSRRKIDGFDSWGLEAK